MLQLLLDGAHKPEAVGTDQCIRPVGKVYTLICMPLAIAVECRWGEHPLRWLDSHSLVGAVLRRYQWRLTENDLTCNKALHV